ncbi:hypothetical protein TNCV_3322601 [Trichonephila clavipes]|nr:hypothetical protein TNCV_3322601 [Trichonephila clavipes]
MLENLTPVENEPTLPENLPLIETIDLLYLLSHFLHVPNTPMWTEPTNHSRVPIDLTLEQTINAEAARRLSGIAHFTNSLAARQRWTKSHSIRAAIISHVLDVYGLKQLQDVSADFQPNRIKIYGNQIADFIEIFEKNINPFDESLDKDSLYNIATAKPVPENVVNFLLNIEKNGEDLQKQFITECAEDQDRFDKPIKKIKCLILLVLQRRKIILGNKVIELRMQRDLFGRLLGISMTNKVEIEKVLEFPLTPISTSMCHADGSICKTDKAQFIKVFKKKVSKVNRQSLFFDISILDGFFMLLLMKEVPQTFDGISKKFPKMISQFKSPRIDIVFDQYFTPSIKDCERLRRNETTKEHEEAKARIIYHICQISVDSQVVVRCSDSDILIILLGNLDHLNASLKLWYQWGVGNQERLISINDLYQDLGISLSKALPCFHAITGWDYTPAFFRKGKLRPFKLLEKFFECQLACQEIITDDDDELERIFATLEKFICHMYGVPNSSNVNDIRFYLFSKTYQSKKLDDNFEKKCRSFDSSSLPPSSEWIVKDDKYDFVWFAGEQFPSSVANIVIKKPTLLENQNTTQDDDSDGIDNNRRSYDDDDYEDASVFCDTFTE